MGVVVVLAMLRRTVKNSCVYSAPTRVRCIRLQHLICVILMSNIITQSLVFNFTYDYWFYFA